MGWRLKNHNDSAFLSNSEKNCQKDQYPSPTCGGQDCSFVWGGLGGGTMEEKRMKE